MSNNRNLHSFVSLVVGVDVMADLGKMHAEFANKKTPPTGLVGIPKSIPYQSLPSSTSVSQHSQSVTDNSAQTVSVPIVCQSTMNMHHDVTDMTSKMTPAGRRMLVLDFFQKVLFRRLKCFIRELHGIYNQSETTVCGLVIKIYWQCAKTLLITCM
jgi:hypothetical protein